MEALCGGNKGNPIPSSIKLELITGNTVEFHLSPRDSHFSDINLLGGSALAIADFSSKALEGTFSLDFFEEGSVAEAPAKFDLGSVLQSFSWFGGRD